MGDEGTWGGVQGILDGKCEQQERAKRAAARDTHDLFWKNECHKAEHWLRTALLAGGGGMTNIAGGVANAPTARAFTLTDLARCEGFVKHLALQGRGRWRVKCPKTGDLLPISNAEEIERTHCTTPFNQMSLFVQVREREWFATLSPPSRLDSPLIFTRNPQYYY